VVGEVVIVADGALPGLPLGRLVHRISKTYVFFRVKRAIAFEPAVVYCLLDGVFLPWLSVESRSRRRREGSSRGGSSAPFPSFFLRFLATYVLLLLIPLTLSVALNSAVLSRFQETVERSRLALLHQTRDVVTQSINDLEWRIFQIAGNPRISRLITEYRSTGAIDSGQIRDLLTYLHGYTLYSSNLKSTFYMYLTEPPVILTPYAMYRHRDFSDDRTFLQIEGTSLSDWHQSILGQYYRRGISPSRRVTIEDFTNKPMIPYVQSLPVGAAVESAAITGAIVYFIGEEEFGSLLRNITLPSGGWAYITDEHGQVLTGISSDDSVSIEAVEITLAEPEGLQRATVNGQDVFVVSTRSSEGWTYVAVLPSQPILAPVHRLQRVSVISLVLSLLISMAIASVISYRRAQPLQNLLDSLRDTVGLDVQEGASVTALNHGVQRLLDQSSRLQGELRRQKSFHQNLLVSRLLEGSFRSANEMRSFLSYLDITIDERCFTAIVISLTGFETLDSVDMIEQMNQFKVVLKELVALHVKERTFIHDASDEKIALIVMSRDAEFSSFEEKLVSDLQTVQRSFEQVYHDQLLIGVGVPRAEILGIASSYEEARRALAVCRQTPASMVTVFTEEAADSRGYYFPIDMEVRITNATRAGDLNALARSFAIIHQENIEKRKLMGSQLRFLQHELVATYQKLVYALASEGFEWKDGQEVLETVEADGDSDDPRFLDVLRQRFVEIAEAMKGRKRSHNRQLIDRIVQYINSHYSDHNLGLYAVASTFSITESYLSFFFKEQIGENFSGYVESVRISRATDLLKSTAASIADIASAVGYNSDKTFRRVFKKVRGISPSDYRREIELRRIV